MLALHVKKLVAAGFPASQATQFVYGIDKTAEIIFKEFSRAHISAFSYAAKTGDLRTKLEVLCNECQTQQTQQTAIFDEGIKSIATQIERVLPKMNEELIAVKAGIMLDISLANKRKAEFESEISAICRECNTYAMQRYAEASEKVKKVELAINRLVKHLAVASCIILTAYSLY